MMTESNKATREMQGFVMQLAADKVGGERVIEARTVTPKEAERLVLEFFQQHGGEDVYYSDIMEALDLDSATVIAACRSLQENKLIEPKKDDDQN